VSLQTVSTGHFATAGITLLEGHDFTGDDRVGAPAVAIVNRSMARRYWPEASAVGQQMRLSSGWATVVGVVADARQRLSEAPMDEVFRPFAQLPLVGNLPTPGHHLFVRSRLDRGVLEAMLRDVVRRVDPKQPIDLVLTLENAREYSVAPFRTTAILIALFALIGVTISTIGVAGVVSASVQARTRELGLQMALGATRRTVVGDVLKEGLRLTGGGLAVGLVLALVLSQALRTLLFGVPPQDVQTFSGVAMLLVAITVTACGIPALRASRVDPSIALRAD